MNINIIYIMLKYIICNLFILNIVYFNIYGNRGSSLTAKTIWVMVGQKKKN